MPKSVVLIPALIQAASRSILPVETLDYDSLSYKPLSTWESRVLASAAGSFISTQIPAKLQMLRGSTSPVRGVIRAHFPKPPDLGSYRWGFASAQSMYGTQLNFNSLAAQFGPTPGQLLQPSPQPSSASRRGLLELVRGWLRP